MVHIPKGYVISKNYILSMPLNICKTHLYLRREMCQKIWVSRDVLVPFAGMWGQRTKHKVDV
jgi:hypothetical protein